MRRLVLCLVLAFGVGPVAAEPEPPPPQRELVRKKPSGFWTSPHPAEDRPYRWGKLAIGGVLIGLTGLLMLRLIKRAGAQRSSRSPRQ